MKGTKTNYILNDHYFDISLLKHSVDYLCIYIYIQLKSIDNLFLKSILHIDGFDKTGEPFNEL